MKADERSRSLSFDMNNIRQAILCWIDLDTMYLSARNMQLWYTVWTHAALFRRNAEQCDGRFNDNDALGCTQQHWHDFDLDARHFVSSWQMTRNRLSWLCAFDVVAMNSFRLLSGLLDIDLWWCSAVFTEQALPHGCQSQAFYISWVELNESARKAAKVEWFWICHVTYIMIYI